MADETKTAPTVTIPADGAALTLELSTLDGKAQAALLAELTAIGRRECSGQVYERALPLLDRLTPQDRATALQRVIDEELDETSLAMRGRRTAEGVAVELFARARAKSPSLELKHLRAVITGVNAEEVLTLMAVAIGT